VRLSDDWELYECELDGVPSRILVDLGARPEAPRDDRPVSLLVRTVRFADDDQAALLALEEALDEALDEAADAVYVGRISDDDSRRFYYYVQDPAPCEAAIQRVGAAASRPLEVGLRHDPEWEHYLDCLYPDRLALQRIANLRALQSLTAAGARAGVHRVEHQAALPDEASAQALAASVEADGFQTDLHRDPSRPALQWLLTLTREQTLSLADLDRETDRLIERCADLGGRYEGWALPTGG
jgi:Family of unknown function (DUF695)/Regulator of ribonuclease activity B